MLICRVKHNNTSKRVVLPGQAKSFGLDFRAIWPALFWPFFCVGANFIIVLVVVVLL